MVTNRTLRFLLNHPLTKDNRVKALLRFLKWQLGTRLNPYPIIYPFGERSKLIAWRGLAGATGNIYCGLHEFEDMSFLLHFLRTDDLFVDVGANIGSYTILSASESRAKTIAMEPVPSTFKNLMNNVYINEVQNLVEAYNLALGSKEGTIQFTKDLDTVNHVATGKAEQTIEVPITTFDTLIQLQQPTLVKIDVEGFETEVIKGMSSAITSPYLKAIIIELNGSGGRYGYEEKDIHNTLKEAGFMPFLYHPFTRTLEAIPDFGNHNTLYIRDLNFVKQRLETARKQQILYHEF